MKTITIRKPKGVRIKIERASSSRRKKSTRRRKRKSVYRRKRRGRLPPRIKSGPRKGQFRKRRSGSGRKRRTGRKTVRRRSPRRRSTRRAARRKGSRRRGRARSRGRSSKRRARRTRGSTRAPPRRGRRKGVLGTLKTWFSPTTYGPTRRNAPRGARRRVDASSSNAMVLYREPIIEPEITEVEEYAPRGLPHGRRGGSVFSGII